MGEHLSLSIWRDVHAVDEGWDLGHELEGSAAVIAKPLARGPLLVQWLCLPPEP
ncbi:MAG: hypothetical protein JRH20_22505 [Deltaproteobacteria bacterium]|nr:hypothetical protein [Deltaproteobacteria bacterium]